MKQYLTQSGLISAIFISIVISLMSCSTSVNKNSSEQYHQLGNKAEDRNNYPLAKTYYEQAFKNNKFKHLNPTQKATILYNLGRVSGYLCQFNQAEQHLLQSLKIEEQNSESNKTAVSMTLFEIARLFFDQKKYDSALPYYKQALIIIEDLPIKDNDPIAYANILDEYSASLTQAGDNEAALAAKTQSEKIRSENPHKFPIFTPIRYSDNCLIIGP